MMVSGCEKNIGNKVVEKEKDVIGERHYAGRLHLEFLGWPIQVGV